MSVRPAVRRAHRPPGTRRRELVLADGRLASTVPVRSSPSGSTPTRTTAPVRALYVYRLRRGDEEHVGVVGDVSARRSSTGRCAGTKPVQPDRVEALVEHFASRRGVTELVALLHRPDRLYDARDGRDHVPSSPLVQFTGPDEWEQTVWRVPDARSAVLVRRAGRRRPLHRRRAPPGRREPATSGERPGDPQARA